MFDVLTDYLNFIVMLLDNRADPGFPHRHLSGFSEATIKGRGHLSTTCLWHKGFHVDDFFCYPIRLFRKTGEGRVCFSDFSPTEANEGVVLFDNLDRHLQQRAHDIT